MLINSSRQNFFFIFNSISKRSLEKLQQLKKNYCLKGLKEHPRPDRYYFEYIFNHFLHVTFGHRQTTY